MTAMTVTFPTAAEFRAWLEAKPADEVIAERCDSYTCPLARCLEISRGQRSRNAIPVAGKAFPSAQDDFATQRKRRIGPTILWRPLITRTA